MKLSQFLFRTGLVAVALSSISSIASAGVMVLNFEGINKTYPTTDYANVENFYNGGTSSDGTSGTNYGVAFSSNALAICLNSMTATCSNTSRGGLGDPNSQQGALFFLSGSQTFMDVAAGFKTGFSFEYVSLSQPGSVSVFSGLDGTGTLLATIDLTPNAGSCPGYNAGFCPFSAVGVNFSGTAESVSFAGVENQIVFDDITFGSSTVGGGNAPEPASVGFIALGGLGMVALSRFRRRHAS